ncbi:hypothetical protein GQ53DRAFT_875575 [Thozetella sp. PMI_491]|nr:hypothetical protein GQ53DRAFT_875575 [Thozetella sp. PMI_491]
MSKLTRGLSHGSGPFINLIQVSALDANTYRAELSPCFNIGSVPNGGYVASCMLNAVAVHLQQRDQTETITAHFEFLNRTEDGPAIIVIEDVKLGRQLSVLHVTLYQDDLVPSAPWVTPGSTRKKIAAYVTNGNITSESGLSLPTYPSLEPAASPVNFEALVQGKDRHWHRMQVPPTVAAFNKALGNCEYYYNRQTKRSTSRIDMWIRFSNGGKFTNNSLAYVADSWPYIVENYRPAPPQVAETASSPETQVPFRFDEIMWYPTVVMNLEVKKALGLEGEEWLFLRVLSRKIHNGRYDLEILILDRLGDLVAISNHVNLILDGGRNNKSRSSL